MRPEATQEQIDAVCAVVRELGGAAEAHRAPRPSVSVDVHGEQLPLERIARMDGVAECLDDGWVPPRARRRARPEGTVVTVRGRSIGGGRASIIAGPCAVESRDQVMRVAELMAELGVPFFRGGAYKPRTSPYSFQGLREEGLRLLAEVRERFGLRIVTEVKDVGTLPAVAEAADVVQIGARNMQNYTLLEAAGRLRKPVLLKRGMSATVAEWLNSAEYILAGGNPEVVLCERGIRTFEPSTRNTLDLSAAVVARRYSHLPVVADPSHAVGLSWAVPALSRAAFAAGLDGVMVEVHAAPSAALSDGVQALTPAEFRTLHADLSRLAEINFQP